MALLDEARQWIDWAFGTFSAARYEEAQWNLNKFQEIYLDNYWRVDGETLAELTRLNARALTLQSMLEERKTWSEPAKWWAPFLPDVTRERVENAGASADAAAKLAQAVAQKTGVTRLQHQAVIQEKDAAQATKEALADLPNAYADFFNREWLGIPVWAWGVGALGLGVLVLVKK